MNFNLFLVFFLSFLKLYLNIIYAIYSWNYLIIVIIIISYTDFAIQTFFFLFINFNRFTFNYFVFNRSKYFRKLFFCYNSFFFQTSVPPWIFVIATIFMPLIFDFKMFIHDSINPIFDWFSEPCCISQLCILFSFLVISKITSDMNTHNTLSIIKFFRSSIINRSTTLSFSCAENRIYYHFISNFHVTFLNVMLKDK